MQYVATILNLYIHTYIYIYIYIYIFVCVSVQVHKYIYIYIYVHILFMWSYIIYHIYCRLFPVLPMSKQGLPRDFSTSA